MKSHYLRTLTFIRANLTKCRHLYKSVGILIIVIILSGCAAAVLPVMLASYAVAGFSVYKVVQTSDGGGEISISFASEDDKLTPPPPLPAGNRVAVWPEDAAGMFLSRQSTYLAEALMQSTVFDVTTPSSVSMVLEAEGISNTLLSLTSKERTSVFSTVCDGANVDIVFASQEQGDLETNVNAFSLSRNNMRTSANMFAYSCSDKSMVWNEQMMITIEGGKSSATAEINKIVAETWVERILEARFNQ